MGKSFSFIMHFFISINFCTNPLHYYYRVKFRNTNLSKFNFVYAVHVKQTICKNAINNLAEKNK